MKTKVENISLIVAFMYAEKKSLNNSVLSILQGEMKVATSKKHFIHL